MNFIMRLFLTLSAQSLIFVSYLLKDYFAGEFGFNIYLLIIVGLIVVGLIAISHFVSLWIIGKFGFRLIGNGAVKNVRPANNDFIVNYSIYLLAALMIPYWPVFLWWFFLSSAMKFYSRVAYFNPLFILLGYNFYYLTLNTKAEILLITKKTIKSTDDITGDRIYRMINEFTFVDCQS